MSGETYGGGFDSSRRWIIPIRQACAGSPNPVAAMLRRRNRTDYDRRSVDRKRHQPACYDAAILMGIRSTGIPDRPTKAEQPFGDSAPKNEILQTRSANVRRKGRGWKIAVRRSSRARRLMGCAYLYFARFARNAEFGAWEFRERRGIVGCESGPRRSPGSTINGNDFAQLTTLGNGAKSHVACSGPT